jgi:hypothetical protein
MNALVCGFGVILLGMSSQVALGKKPLKPLDAGALCGRLQLTEEVLTFDESGTHIVDVFARTDKSGRGGAPGKIAKTDSDGAVCRSRSRSRHENDALSQPIVFAYTTRVMADGTLQMVFEQGTGVEGRGGERHLAGGLGEKKWTFPNFEPFVWVSPLHKGQRVIVRIIPSLTRESETLESGELPIVLENATVFDGKGNLWAANLNADGKYMLATTVFGTISMSFMPFKGAEKLGRAIGNEIRFAMPDGRSVVMRGTRPLVPGDYMADVYMVIDTTHKASSIQDQHISTGDDPEETFKR